MKINGVAWRVWRMAGEKLWLVALMKYEAISMSRGLNGENHKKGRIMKS